MIQTLTGHVEWVGTVAFSLDDKLLASASKDGMAKLWDPATGAPLHTLVGHTFIRTLSFSSGASYL